MILTVVLLTLSTVNVAFSTLFPHPDMCGVYQQRPLYLDRGMYLVPLVMQLPDNCHKSECRRVDNATELIYLKKKAKESVSMLQ